MLTKISGLLCISRYKLYLHPIRGIVAREMIDLSDLGHTDGADQSSKGRGSFLQGGHKPAMLSLGDEALGSQWMRSLTMLGEDSLILG